VVDKVDFQTVVDGLEESGDFKSHSELWEAVAASAWGRGLRGRRLTAAFFCTRARELGVVVKTPTGKRGRGNSKRSDKLKRHSRTYELLLVQFPLAYRSVVKAAQEGSLRAAIKAKCLDCSNFQREEIKYCQVVDCALYPIRPYQESSASKEYNEEETGAEAP
jgi:hypothetical protein